MPRYTRLLAIAICAAACVITSRPCLSQWSHVLDVGTHTLSEFDGTILGGASGGRVVVSVDAGLTWRTAMVDSLVQISDVEVVNSDTMYAATRRAGLYQSTDGGRTWHHFALTTAYVDAVMSIPGTGAILASVYLEDVYRLDNAGTNNGQVVLERERWPFVKHSMELLDDGRPIVGTQACFELSCGSLHISNDHGYTWEAIPGWQMGWAASVVRAGRRDTATFHVLNSDALFTTRDGGQSFEPRWAPFLPTSVVELRDGRLIVGWYEGVSLLTDDGSRWTSFDLDNVDVLDLVVADYVIVAGSHSGIFRRLDAATAVEGKRDVDNQLLAFPNPTHGILNIDLQQHDDMPSFRVVDMTGETVGNGLLRQVVQGQYQIDLSGLPSAVYIVVIHCGRRSHHARVVKL